MLGKVRKFVRKHVGRDKSKRKVASVNQLMSSSTPDLTRVRDTPSPYNTDPYVMPLQNQVYSGSFGGYRRMGEERRNGSAIPYSQSLGDVSITNPDPTPAASSESLFPTSSNLAHCNPTHFSNLLICAEHRKHSMPLVPTESTVSYTSSSSRTSLVEVAPINDDLTAAMHTTPVWDGSDGLYEQEGDTRSPRFRMNPLGLNPPSMPMGRPSSLREPPTRVNEQEEIEHAASPVGLPRPSSRLGFYQDSSFQPGGHEELELVATPMELPRPASRLDFYPESPTEIDMTSENNLPVSRLPSGTETYPSSPVAEHPQTRIHQRHITTYPSPLTTAEFPAEFPGALRTLGPYARYPNFERSSDYQYPHDEPFFFNQEDVRPHDNAFGSSANLTRPLIDNYWIRRGSNPEELFIDEPDREIYSRRSVELNRPPISYLHSRYPRHLPAQLTIGSPFPSEGPVNMAHFRARMPQSVVRRYPKRSKRNPTASSRQARMNEITQSLNRRRSSGQLQRREHGRISAADPLRRTRRYHSYDYHPIRQIGRQWEDVIIESSRENSISGPAVSQVHELSGAEAEIASPPRAVNPSVPQLRLEATKSSPTFSFAPRVEGPVSHQTTTGDNTTPISTSPLSNAPQRSSSTASCREHTRLQMLRAARINSFRRDYQLTVQWLEQNNTRTSSQDFINIP